MKYYVYELVDPRNGWIFYVGKGCGARPDHHTLEAKRGIKSAKCDVIRDILTSGHQVTAIIVKRFSDEAAAYTYEKAVIAEYGLANLTNIAAGGGTPIIKDQDLADLRWLVQLSRKTNGFSPLYGTYDKGTFVSMGAFFFHCTQGAWENLRVKRGQIWIDEQLKLAA